ncbi:MAG: tetratricopeptide repeat protein [Pseudomonadota bacterium]
MNKLNTALKDQDLQAKYGEGLRHLENGDVKGAQKAFENILVMLPDNPVVLERMGYSYAVQENWQQAEVYFRKANALVPQNTKVLNNLGYVLQKQYKNAEDVFISLALGCFAKGQEKEALHYINSLKTSPQEIERALGNICDEARGRRQFRQAAHACALLSRLQPQNEQCLTAYIANLRQSGAGNKELEKCLIPAMKKFPKNTFFPLILSEVYAQEKKFSQALKAAETYCENASDVPIAHMNYAKLHLQQQKSEFGKIIDLDPIRAACMCAIECCGENKADCITIVQSLIELRDIKLIEEILQTETNYKHRDILCELLQGYISYTKQDFKKAKKHYNKALKIVPENSFIYTELSRVSYELNQPEDALKASYKSVELLPENTNARAMYWHSVILNYCGVMEEGLEASKKAVEIKPYDPHLKLGLGIQYLRRGDWQKGWSLYENRLKLGGQSTIKYIPPVPKWNGESFEELDLILCCEQGLGDIVQFARFVPAIAQKTKRTFFNIQKKLRHLFQHFEEENGKIRLIEAGSEFSVNSSNTRWCPLMDLPFMLDLEETQWSENMPYIFSHSDQVKKWHERFRAFGPKVIKVGIVWQGNPELSVDLGRSIPLKYFKPLNDIKNVQLISLQKTHGLDQLRQIDFSKNIHLLGDDFDEGEYAFSDAINAMEALDLIITSDTSIAHIAGALGRPVWLGLKFAAEWRWQIERNDSPWYPTMSIFRQHQIGDWRSVISAMAQNLEQLAKGDQSVLYTEKKSLKNKNNASALLNSALNYKMQNKMGQAIVAYQDYVNIHPENISVRESLAELLYETDQSNVAHEHYDFILKHASNKAKTLISIALCCFVKGKVKKALDCIAQLKASQADIEYTLVERSNQAIAKKDFQRAANACGLLNAYQPQNANFLIAYFINSHKSGADLKFLQDKLLKAIKQFPDVPFFPKLLCDIYEKNGFYQKALAIAQVCAQNIPNEPSVHINYANLHLQNQKLKHRKIDDITQPAKAYLQALQLSQNNKDNCIAIVQCLIDQRVPELAQACLEKIKDIDLPDIVNLLLQAYLAFTRRDFSSAKQHFEAAQKHAPANSLIYTELAKTLYHLGQPEHAVKMSYQSIAHNKNDPKTISLHGILLTNCGLYKEGLAASKKAVDMDPENADFKINLGQQYLLRGDWEKGGPLVYKNRLNRSRNRPLIVKSTFPKWDGESLKGKNLIICSEQGLGDIVQFARFLPTVAQQTERTLVYLRKNIAHLFWHFEADHSNIEYVEPGEELSVNRQNTVWCSLMDLPFLLKLKEHDWSENCPYIFAQQDEMPKWQNYFNTLDAETLKVGIVWQGNPEHEMDIGRSIPLQAFKPLSEIKNIQLVSLQKYHGLDQLEHIDFAPKIHFIKDRFDEAGQSFADTVNIMAALDLIITSDTSIAHIAGALGRPVWLGLRFASEWRWQLERKDSPWYPTMKIFRQKDVGDWRGLVLEMVKDLKLSLK